MVKSQWRKWRQDSYLGRVFKNFGLLLSGRGVAAVLSLGTLSLMGHGLSPVQFGLVVLVHTYAMTAKGLLTIQPATAVIHFGVKALQGNNPNAFKHLVAYALAIDLAGGAFAALVAILVAPLLASKLHWDAHMVHLAQIYCTMLLFAAESTSHGLMRLFNRFDLLSAQGVLRPTLRIIGVGAAFVFHAPLAGYLLAWYISNIAHFSTLIFLALRITRKKVEGPLFIGFDAASVHRECPRIWPYMLVLYWQNLLDLTYKHVATLLAGALFGTVAAGLYKVAWDMSNVLAKPVMVLRDSILPDLARLWHEKNPAFRRLTYRSGFIAGSVSAVILTIVIFAGKGLISLVMGHAYVAAAPLLTLLMMAGTIDLYGFALRPAGYAMGRPGVVVGINTFATMLYGALFFGLSSYFGLLAPGFAAVTSASISLILLALAVFRLSGQKAEA